MQRFRLLGLYVAGVAAVSGLAIWGVSLRRSAAKEEAPVAPAAAGTEPMLSHPTASRTSPPAAASGAASVAKVSIADFVFHPKELVVTAGTVVTWVNGDDVPHTATGSASPPPFDSRTLDTDGKFSFEFKTPGTYDYFCKLHPQMTGKIVVK
jgi:plastocyanin